MKNLEQQDQCNSKLSGSKAIFFIKKVMGCRITTRRNQPVKIRKKKIVKEWLNMKDLHSQINFLENCYSSCFLVSYVLEKAKSAVRICIR